MMDDHSNMSETTLSTFSHNQQTDTESGEWASNGSEPSLVPKMPDHNEDEMTFDTGLKAWLQVVGAFFIFFNSW